MFDLLLLTCGQACLYKSPNVAREIICELININFHSHCFIGNESNYNCNTVLPFLIQQEDNLSQGCPSQIQKRCNPLHQDLARCVNVTFVPLSPPSPSSSGSNNSIKGPQRGFLMCLHSGLSTTIPSKCQSVSQQEQQNMVPCHGKVTFGDLACSGLYYFRNKSWAQENFFFFEFCFFPDMSSRVPVSSILMALSS